MMIRTLCKSISLKNLNTARPGGQVTTLLILLMVVVLMFILVTMNIGNIADLSTMLSNAADTASLQLASSLATKSYQLSEALDDACGSHDECCQKTGLLGVILAVIVAIIMTILQQYWYWVVLAAAVAGAVGNYIVYGTAEAALMGAIMGAIIGATIYIGITSCGELLAGESAASASSEAFTWSLLVEGTSVQGAAAAAELAAQAVLIQGIPGGLLMGASAIYNESVNQKMKSTALKKFGDALNGLPEHDKIRETAMLTSLSMTVTDPVMTIPGPAILENTVTCGTINPLDVLGGDPSDIDGDGDREESTTCFENWYYYRISQIKNLIIAQYRDAIDNFINWHLIPYRNYIETLYTNGGPLSRQEIEGADGLLIEVLRALETGYPPPPRYDFWTPGPNKADLELWQTCTVGNCPAACLTVCPSGCQDCILTGYDEIDWNISSFKDFVGKADSIIASTSEARAANWQDWISWFIGVRSTCAVCGHVNTRQDVWCTNCGALLPAKAYYKKLLAMVSGDSELEVKGYCTWMDYFFPGDAPDFGVDDTPAPDWGVIDLLPDCTYDPVTGEATNPPCKNSIDRDPEDEALNAYFQVWSLLSMTQSFISGLQGFHYQMLDMLGRSAGDQALNPVEYGWEDGQGQHTIQVRVGPFEVPEIGEDSRGNFLVGEECIVLEHGSDTSGSKTWVMIRRSDPTNKLKSGKRALGWWNPPFHSNLGNTITRISRASFTRDGVTVCGRDINNNCNDDTDNPY